MVALSHEAKLKLDQLLESAVTQNTAPAIVFAAGTPERELYAKYVGKQAIDSPSTKDVSKDSVFWLCSMTKLVVTIAALQLVEQGKIGLDTPVGDFVPELKNPVVIEDRDADTLTYRPAKNPILLHHLLSHTSGIEYDLEKRTPGHLNTAYAKVGYRGGDVTEERFLEILKAEHPAIPLAFEPGTGWGYGFSLDILVIVLQRVTGIYIESYCRQNIFGPLGINATFRLTPDVKSNLIQLAFREEDGSIVRLDGQRRLIEQDPEKIKFCFGGIGLYSNLDDYLVLLRHILSIYVGHINHGILSTSSVQSLFHPDVPNQGEVAIKKFTGWPSAQFGFGLCLNLEDWEGMRRSGSGFWWGYAGTYFFMDTTTGIAAVMGTQLLPRADPAVLNLWKAAEKALYSGLIVA